MTQFDDSLYLGGTALPAGQADMGVGPLGRVTHYNIVPLIKQTNNIATSQHMTAATALSLTAGTGVTSAYAPDGSGRLVYAFDVPRAVSLSSTANLSAISFTIRGYDIYGQPMTQTRVGPNNNTVNTTKAFSSVLSVTPGTTDGSNNITVGSSDILGLPYCITDAGYLTAVGWNNTLARDAGTFVAAVTTDPATATTGDVRGTYVPSSATDGSKRLVIQMHLKASQFALSARAALLGVTQV